MSQNLRQVTLKYKSSSIGFGEMAQDLTMHMFKRLAYETFSLVHFSLPWA